MISLVIETSSSSIVLITEAVRLWTPIKYQLEALNVHIEECLVNPDIVESIRLNRRKIYVIERRHTPRLAHLVAEAELPTWDVGTIILLNTL
ncbi:unnamed protein product [Bursaphelenchus xylophilus]|uniref:(pine wood nematode) hypothetical protein n=1 Tax=Bursaphelenchus xylophilus TaxID=6326 RepID=A0A1I7SRX1_BURXY|nr:unnamed protein product [Bursaphelenchus xylophilus]CAG9101756.1 unnamed protein product [Bursaphelenchus xylophilus]